MVHPLLLVLEIMEAVVVEVTGEEVAGEEVVETIIMMLEVVEAVIMMVEVVEVVEVVLMAVIKEEMIVVMVRFLHLHPPLMVGQMAITHLQIIMVGTLVMEQIQFLRLQAILEDLIHIPHRMVLLVVMVVML